MAMTADKQVVALLEEWKQLLRKVQRAAQSNHSLESGALCCLPERCFEVASSKDVQGEGHVSIPERLRQEGKMVDSLNADQPSGVDQSQWLAGTNRLQSRPELVIRRERSRRQAGVEVEHWTSAEVRVGTVRRRTVALDARGSSDRPHVLPFLMRRPERPTQTHAYVRLVCPNDLLPRPQRELRRPRHSHLRQCGSQALATVGQARVDHWITAHPLKKVGSFEGSDRHVEREALGIERLHSQVVAYIRAFLEERRHACAPELDVLLHAVDKLAGQKDLIRLSRGSVRGHDGQRIVAHPRFNTPTWGCLPGSHESRLRCANRPVRAPNSHHMIWFALSAVAAMTLLLPGGALLRLRMKRYAQFLGYDPRLSASLASATRVAELPIHNCGNVELPASDRPVTALIAVEVRSSLWGRVADPYVSVDGPGGVRRQYFERGVRGLRYLNVTGCLPSDHSEGASLTVAFVRCRPGPSAHVLYFPREEIGGPVLTVAPHPDDAELSSFSVWSDRDAWVITVSAGEIGTTSYGDLFPEDEAGARLRGQTRVTESLTAPLLGGVRPERIANLGYFDGTLEPMARDSRIVATSGVAGTSDLRTFRRSTGLSLPDRDAACWSNLVDDLAQLIATSQPHTLIAPHPLLDHHPDHRFTGLATLEAALRSTDHLCEGGQLLLYVVHPPISEGAVGLHPVGPRDGVVSVPPGTIDSAWFDGLVSYELNGDQRRRKALAVDTYRDLREEAFVAASTPVPKRIRNAVREIYRALVVYDASLFRRHLRPNELFFSVPFDALERVHEEFRSALLGEGPSGPDA